MKRLIFVEGQDPVEIDDPDSTPVVIVSPVPNITKRQLLLTLLALGIEEADVDAAIDAIADSKARAMARIEWKHSTTYERTHPLIEQIGTALLGVTPAVLDNLFREAARIP